MAHLWRAPYGMRRIRDARGEQGRRVWPSLRSRDTSDEGRRQSRRRPEGEALPNPAGAVPGLSSTIHVAEGAEMSSILKLGELTSPTAVFVGITLIMCLYMFDFSVSGTAPSQDEVQEAQTCSQSSARTLTLLQSRAATGSASTRGGRGGAIASAKAAIDRSQQQG
jgi:hypothetical protein